MNTSLTNSYEARINTSSTNPYEVTPKIKIIKRVTKTIEKYDSGGKLIGKEVITEEYEDIERETWEPNRWTTPPEQQDVWVLGGNTGNFNNSLITF